MPHGIISAAITSKNKVMQTWTPWTSVCRSRLMSLIMTFMFEPAKLQMNWARANGTSIFRSDEAETPTVAPLVMSMRSSLLPGEPARSRPRSWDSLD